MADHNTTGRPDDEGAELDELLLRVRDTLAPLPTVNPQSIARVLVATGGARAPQGAGARLAAWVRGVTARRWSLAGVGGVAVAALAIGFVTRGAFSDGAGVTGGDAPSSVAVTAPSPGAPAPAGASAASGAMIRAAGDGADEEAPVPVQFVLDARVAGDARTVSLVADFNDWSIDAAPMERLAGSPVWTVTVLVKPGRHVYAFVLDADRWIADPRAPRAGDDDFGRPGSVVFVGNR